MTPSAHIGRNDSNPLIGPRRGWTAAAITTAVATAHANRPPRYSEFDEPDARIQTAASAMTDTTAAPSSIARARTARTGPRTLSNAARPAPTRIEAIRVSVPK